MFLNFRSGLDTRSEACQRFFREGMTVSFTKILTDDAVSGWKYDIQVSSAPLTDFVSPSVAELALLFFPYLKVLYNLLPKRYSF